MSRGARTSKWLADKALSKLRDMPRVSFKALVKREEPEMYKFQPKPIYSTIPNVHIRYYDKAMRSRKLPPIGYEHLKTPIAHRTPKEKSYNYGWFAKRQYPPLSLKTLQLMIDTGRLDPTKPIDLAAIANTKVFPIRPQFQHFGVNLTDEGVDNFETRINIEVQYASEMAIAAVERLGGTITTAYFDIESVEAMINPKQWFLQGKPIPRRLTPPADAIEYYTSAVNRGYLSNPEEVAKERLVLAQKYGYELQPLEDSDPLKPMLTELKDPRQVFYGLQPGWIVNLADKVIIKPNDPELESYYTA